MIGASLQQLAGGDSAQRGAILIDSPRITEVVMSGTPAVNEHATHVPSAATVDLKLEVVAIPVADVNRAKAFYEGLGWTLNADFMLGKDFRAVPAYAARVAVLDSSGDDGSAGLCSGNVPRRLRR